MLTNFRGAHKDERTDGQTENTTPPTSGVDLYIDQNPLV